MNITIFKMDDKYVCSSNADEGLDFEDLCKKLVAFNLKKYLLEAVPRLNDIKDDIEIEVEWIYEGYRVFVLGSKLTDWEIMDFVERLDPVKNIGICDLFWKKHTEQRECTGIVLAYDFKHYHKVVVGTHRFIIMTYNGIDEFLEILGMAHEVLPFEYEKLVRQLHFEYDKETEKRIQIQMLKGTFDLPKAEYKNQGRMHTRRNFESSRFDDYWEKKFRT